MLLVSIFMAMSAIKSLISIGPHHLARDSSPLSLLECLRDYNAITRIPFRIVLMFSLECASAI